MRDDWWVMLDDNRPRRTMISLLELLEDPTYKEFFTTVPKLPRAARHPGMTPPWRLWAQLGTDRKWRSKDFPKYSEAFTYFKVLRKKHRLIDAAINCKRVATPAILHWVDTDQTMRGSDGKIRPVQKQVLWLPPLPSDEVDEHIWCPYCRRPTAFKYFTRHHALLRIGVMIDPSIPRCIICGASSRMIISAAA
jgi:hypothetical protein